MCEMAQESTKGGFRDIQWTSLRGRRIISAFIAGILFSVLAVVAGVYLHPGEVIEFTAGRFQLLFIGLFIGISTGHYLGTALGNRADVNIAAATGAFLTIALAFLYLVIRGEGAQGLIGPGGALVISTFLLVLGHYSLLLEHNQAIEGLIQQFAERFSPALLGIMWLGETILPTVFQLILPKVGLAEIGGALLSGLELGAAAAAVIVVIWVISKLGASDSER